VSADVGLDSGLQWGCHWSHACRLRGSRCIGGGTRVEMTAFSAVRCGVSVLLTPVCFALQLQAITRKKLHGEKWH